METTTRREFLAQVARPTRRALAPVETAEETAARTELSQGPVQVPETAAGASPYQPPPPASSGAHIASRFQYGAKPGDAASIDAIGLNPWLATQFSPSTISDSACDTLLAALPRATQSETVTQLYDRRSNANYDEKVRPARETRDATYVRRAHSKRQLLELTVEFWHDHFNIFGFDSDSMLLFPLWDKVMRANAFGNFRTLLGETAKHPAMLYYLDNYISTDGGPNENYARELFELHTLGAGSYQVTGGYIDADVYEAARCFTGWTYERGSAVASRGQFKYVAADHDRFQKQVLGVQLPNDQAALKDGDDVLTLLANHPGTARHIARKLCLRFSSDTPSEALVQSVADVWYATRTYPDQIKRVLDHLIHQPECYTFNRFRKFKRPQDWVSSTMRALNLTYKPVVSGWDMNWYVDPMGQSMFGWRPPNGAPDRKSYWATANNFFRRCNFVFQLDSGWYEDDGFVLNVTGVMPADRKTPREIATWWIDRVIMRPVSPNTANALIDFMAEGRNPDLPLAASRITSMVPHLAVLCVTTPEFMMR